MLQCLTCKHLSCQTLWGHADIQWHRTRLCTKIETDAILDRAVVYKQNRLITQLRYRLHDSSWEKHTTTWTIFSQQIHAFFVLEALVLFQMLILLLTSWGRRKNGSTGGCRVIWRNIGNICYSTVWNLTTLQRIWWTVLLWHFVARERE